MTNEFETYCQRHIANSAVWYEMQQVILFSPLMIFAPGFWTIKKKKFSNKRLVRCAYKMANVYTIWVWRELGKSSLQFFFIRYFFHFLAAHAAISPPRSKSSDNLAELSRSTPGLANIAIFLDLIHPSFLLFLPSSDLSWRAWPSNLSFSRLSKLSAKNP